MKITYYSSDDELLKEIGRRIKALRIKMELSQSDLAVKSGVSSRTVSNLENGKDVAFGTVIDILRVLGRVQSLDVLLPENVMSPSQIADLGKQRERVPRKKRAENNTGWTWGDEK